MKIKSIKQFIKFGFVGVSNTVISLATYYFLVWLSWPYVIANIMGFLLSVINSYFWNSKFVFDDKTEKSNVKAFTKVFLSYLVSLCVSTILMTVMVEVLHISEYIAPVLRLIVTVPLNFIANKFWAFRTHQNHRGVSKEKCL